MGRLNYPVNDKYDFNDFDAADQSAFANPVVVSNKQIDLANALIEVTARHNALNDERVVLKQQLTLAEADLEDFELKIWSVQPPPASDRKTNKLLEAYTVRVVVEQAKLPEYRKLQLDIRGLKTKLIEIEGKIENCRNLAQAIKIISENGKTFLAYVKDEARRAGGYT